LLDPERKEIRDVKKDIKKNSRNDRGIIFEQWKAPHALNDNDHKKTILIRA
jgi:hypothetical protein